MKPRYTIVTCGGAMLVVALSGVSLPAQAASGNLIKITTTMSISGMGNMPLHSYTNTVCMAAKKPDFNKIVHQRKDCKVTKFNQSGNHYSYHMVCTGRAQMTGDGSFTSMADGGFTGEMHMISTAEGHPMDMVMNYSGKRLGSCNYTPTKQP